MHELLTRQICRGGVCDGCLIAEAITRAPNTATKGCFHANLEHLGDSRSFLRCENCCMVFVLHSVGACAIPAYDSANEGTESH